MMFGEYKEPKEQLITSMRGEKIHLKTPAGYSGLFWGRVHDENGNQIREADLYFIHMARDNGEDIGKYCDMIIEFIDQHCLQYVGPYVQNNKEYGYQTGFGGDESDGLIDFWLAEQIPIMPDLEFTIENKKYTIQWDYSSGEF